MSDFPWDVLISVLGTIAGAWIGARAAIRTVRLQLTHQEKTHFHHRRVEAYAAYLQVLLDYTTTIQHNEDVDVDELGRANKLFVIVNFLGSRPVKDAAVVCHETVVGLFEAKKDDRADICQRFLREQAQLEVSMRRELGIT
jgi:hypothetical protein